MAGAFLRVPYGGVSMSTFYLLCWAVAVLALRSTILQAKGVR